MSTVRLQILNKHSAYHYYCSLRLAKRYYSEHAKPPDHRASSKLFQDAANEEAEEAEQAVRANRLTALETKHENWTGEESMQDAVLRMLVDKYKPLREGPIRTADEKLKKAPPKPGTIDGADTSGFSSSTGGIVEENVVVRTTWGASSRSMADVPLLPSVEGHQPWHTTFQVPSHAQSSIKYGQIPVTVPTRSMPPAPLDDKARRQAKEAKKRTEHAGRLRNAKESTLDYKLGMKDGKGSVVRRRPNPVSLKGWAGLIEDRIEVRYFSGIWAYTYPASRGHDRKVVLTISKGAGNPCVSTLKNATRSLPVRSFF